MLGHHPGTNSGLDDSRARVFFVCSTLQRINTVMGNIFPAWADTFRSRRAPLWLRNRPVSILDVEKGSIYHLFHIHIHAYMYRTGTGVVAKRGSARPASVCSVLQLINNIVGK